MNSSRRRAPFPHVVLDDVIDVDATRSTQPYYYTAVEAQSYGGDGTTYWTLRASPEAMIL
jgi:hypothetical protein